MDSNSVIIDKVLEEVPFSLLPLRARKELINSIELVQYLPGERIIRSDELSQHMYLIIKGQVRLLVQSTENNELITISKEGEGYTFGWVGIFRGEPCETVNASTDVLAARIKIEDYVSLCNNYVDFQSKFENQYNQQEAWYVIKEYCNRNAFRPKDLNQLLKSQINSGILKVIHDELELEGTETSSFNYYVSSKYTNRSVGTELHMGESLKRTNNFQYKARLIGLKAEWQKEFNQHGERKLNTRDKPEEKNNGKNDVLNVEKTDLLKLGVVEHEEFKDEDKFPSLKGRGIVNEGLAILEMICLNLKLPFRKEICKKFLIDQRNRGKDLSIESIGSMCEMLGCQSQIGVVNASHLESVDYPAIEVSNGHARILWCVIKDKVIVSDPRRGLNRISVNQLSNEDPIKLLLVKRSVNANTAQFGWSWFTPLVNKYKWALVLVFGATLLSQLMNLAIPLLLQQIIDKVLNQGNISTLNVLGSTMIVLALFSGLLTALRQFIFVDTTDRMDLTLGSAVIDRLLSLPLRYFEKRPVGELSQRLGELNNIRGFLTGTALISVMNLFFALMYLVVMVIYSPLLTAVALSTFPIYLALVIFIAPIFKQMIRKKAIAQARTSSHLIEVLTGIQTVKAQNSQLTSRWKWQDRYKEFVNQGFRAVTVGTISGQIGGFLTQLSSLMVIWIGMIEVLNGNLTLGQLIAFRIIAGNVTGPLLQLSTLWQGFQGVQLSMERLGDILNQTAEQTPEESLQIALPPLQGNLRYENVKFRFGKNGPYQVNDVDLSVEAGSFIGIVGQSGSGKSTLMKLLPRLYRIDEGNIYIDNYDISKVELNSLRKQIGMVPQDSLLFEGTIAENIALNDPTADDEDIIKAATIACAHEFIMGLPQGYATPIAERGSNLSGGQRQRIAIARTILDNPKLLIMDEATSALDYETERIVCMNIQQWAKDKTVMFITHRLNTIKTADKIILMSNGKIAEEGTHEELINKNGRYSILYKQQGIAEGL